MISVGTTITITTTLHLRNFIFNIVALTLINKSL